MKDKDYTDWCLQMKYLTHNQKVQALLKLRQLADGGKPEPDWLFDGLCLAMQNRGVLNQLTRRNLIKSDAFKRYQIHAPEVQQALLDLLKNIPASHLAKLALARTAGEVLIKWCKYRTDTVTPAIVLNNIRHTFDALERAFPLYHQSGLLGAAIVSPERVCLNNKRTTD